MSGYDVYSTIDIYNSVRLESVPMAMGDGILPKIVSALLCMMFLP